MSKLGRLALIFIVSAGVGAGAYRIKAWAYKHLPVAAPGQCVVIDNQGQPYKLMILDNSSKFAASMVGDEYGNIAVVKYSDLRKDGATKVPCEE